MSHLSIMNVYIVNDASCHVGPILGKTVSLLKTPRDGASDTPRLLIAFSHNYIVNYIGNYTMTDKQKPASVCYKHVGPILGNNIYAILFYS
jgi:hypothetical protein